MPTPDAATATAVLGAVSLSKRTVALLKGESLFKGAAALLLFGAAPGGILFGIAASALIRG